ncbi:MAG: AAA family ATPase [Pirellulaceae bacterium]
MLTLLGSENETTARAIREFFQQRGGLELRQVPLDQLVVRTAQLRPDCVLLTINGNDEQASAILREVQEVQPVRMIVIGPSSDARLILRMMKEGAFHYVDETELDEGLTTALRKLRSEPPLSSDRGRVIAVMGVIGGCGASMLAANIATTYARKDHSCCLLDMRLEAGDLSALLNVQPEHSLADFCANVDRMDDSMFAQCFATHASGVQLMAAPVSYKEVGRVTARGLRKALFMARGRFHYVVVDVDRNYRAEQVQVLLQADAIVMVLRADIPSLRQARRVLDYMVELSIPSERLHLVVNRFSRRRDVSLRDIETTLGLPIAGTIPEDVKRIERSMNRGTPVVAYWPRADVSAKIAHVAASVNGRMD